MATVGWSIAEPLPSIHPRPETPPARNGRVLPFVFVAAGLLLVAPALAVHRLLGPAVLAWAAGWMAAFSLITLGLYAFDQRRARSGGGRIPEATLHLAELLGGWPGAFLAQHLLRHKNAKVGYQVVFWLIVAFHQFVAVDAWRGWALLRAWVAL